MTSFSGREQWKSGDHNSTAFVDRFTDQPPVIIIPETNSLFRYLCTLERFLMIDYDYKVS